MSRYVWIQWSFYVVFLRYRLCVPHLLRQRVGHQSPERPPWTENTARGKSPSLSVSLYLSICLYLSVCLFPPLPSLSLFLSMAVGRAICTRLHTSRHSPCIVPEMKNTLESNSINSSAFWRPGFNFSMCLFPGGYCQHWSDPLCLALFEAIAKGDSFWGGESSAFLQRCYQQMKCQTWLGLTILK